MIPKHKLTKAQQRLLDRLPQDGSPKRLTGRARSMVEALERAGLVDADWDLEIRVIGKAVERVTVRRKIVTSEEQ